MIIGDLDSVSAETIEQMEKAGVTIRGYPRNKDQTDLELALDMAVAEKPAEILLVTALGGRLDQTLANILLLTRPEYGSTRLTLIDGPQSATLIQDHQRLRIEGEPGDTLSLVPLTPQVTQVTFTGVAWPLNEATLTLGSTWSISNTLEGRQANVEIGKGMALLVHFKQNCKLED
jgi:thiamine pyrophosphokinase